MFNLPSYRITPSAHPVKCPPQCPSHIHPHPRPSHLTSPLVHFPELGVFMFCLPFWYFLPSSSPFPTSPFHYYLYSPNEWEHIMFVLLRLTYFTQHNTLQFHPRRSKWWVFVIELRLDSCFFLGLHIQYVRCLCVLALPSKYNPTGFLHF